jgi:nucleotide-binding universal stress UspA family protein
MVNLPLPIAGPWGLMPDASMADLYRQLREQGEANVAALKNKLKDEAVSHEVQLVQAFFSEPSGLAAHLAHTADLSVVAITPTDTVEGDISRTYFGSMLIDSGRPVLAVPPRCKVPMPPKRIVIAWRQTRECARAVHDAMPLLQAAEAVGILIVDPAGGETGEGERPGVGIQAHLNRHGVKATVQVRESHDNRIAAVLHDFVVDTRANMLVAGGYGHSRLREWALGGVTRELLFETTVPVFFSH